MKIDSSSTSQIAAVKDAAEKRATQADTQVTSDAQVTGSAPVGQPVSLSAASTDLRTSSSDIDTAKVASIKAALAGGTYKIDAGNIADGMLTSTSELMKSKTSPAGN